MRTYSPPRCCPTEQLQAARAAVRALLLRGQHKLHWRDENEQRRKLLTAAVADLEALHLVVVHVDLQASASGGGGCTCVGCCAS